MLLWEVTVARTPSGWRFHGSKMTQFLFLIKNDSENTLRKVFDDFENFFFGGGGGGSVPRQLPYDGTPKRDFITLLTIFFSGGKTK